MEGKKMSHVFSSAEELFNSIIENRQEKQSALLLLFIRHWMFNICEFDPLSGEPMPASLSAALEKIDKAEDTYDKMGLPGDQISRIGGYITDALRLILKSPKHNILREHDMMPAYAAKEVDSTSLLWLSRQSGRTIREKLASKPYMKAVRRRISTDTAENRLLKAFCIRLENILDLKSKAFPGEKDSAIQELQQVLTAIQHSEDFEEAGVWKNLPPNNALLHDRNYRKVWNAWLWLQALDDSIEDDAKRMEEDFQKMIFWDLVSRLYQSGRMRSAEQPCFLDFNKFDIKKAVPEFTCLIYDMPGMHTGTISHLDEKKKTGVVSDAKWNSYFFSFDDISKFYDYDQLKKGMKVSFEPVKEHSRHRAKQIRITECAVPVLIRQEDCSITFSYSGWNLKLVIPGLAGNYDSQRIKKTFHGIDEQFGGEFINFHEKAGDKAAAVKINDDLAIDLYSLRPSFACGTKKGVLPVRLLRQYWNTEDYENLGISLNKSKAVLLDKKHCMISMLSVLSDNNKTDQALLSDAAIAFAGELREIFDTDKVTYLVPDAANDFVLEKVRRSMNIQFSEANPLPRSIAAVFAWQMTSGFQKTQIGDGDCVLVMETFDDVVTLTPVISTVEKKKELTAIVPESCGITWERHPSFYLKNPPSADKICENILSEMGFGGTEVADLCSLNGVMGESDRMSWQTEDGRWLTVSDDFKKKYKEAVTKYNMPWKEINDFLNQIRKQHLGKNPRIFLLPAEKYFSLLIGAGTNQEIKILDVPDSLAAGAVTLNKWQAKAGGIPMWKDHLPELSIRVPSDGRYEDFHLVEDKTVTPLRGKTVPIEINEAFVLPKGQAFYQFPLVQHSDRGKQRFVLYLKSPRFPLQEDTVCRLELTFTYGNDNPYELKFIPQNTAKGGFKMVKAEWRQDIPDQNRQLQSPGYFNRNEWSDFYKYPKRDNDGTSDLIKWITDTFEEVNGNINYMTDRRRRHTRILGKVTKWNMKNTNGVTYGFICPLSDPSESYYTNVHYFDDPHEAENVSEGIIVSFDPDKERGAAKHVTIGETISPRVSDRMKDCRFPMLVVWNQGHSLSEPDAPSELRRIVHETSENFARFLETEEPEELKKKGLLSLADKIFYNLCLMHKDAPLVVGKRLKEIMSRNNPEFKSFRETAYAIGDGSYDWQRELLGRLVQFAGDKSSGNSSSALQALSITIWRSEKNVFYLNKEQLGVILNSLAKLFSSLKEIKKDKMNEEWITSLTFLFELLLGLLRAAESPDPEIKALLSLRNPDIVSLIESVDAISDKISGINGVKMNFRITLQLNKPEELHGVPDIIYALQKYLKGETGTNTIRILSVNEDE